MKRDGLNAFAFISMLMFFSVSVRAESLQIREAEDCNIGFPACKDNRSNASGQANVHLSGADGGKAGGYVEFTSELPYDVYYVFARVRAGTLPNPYFGEGTYNVNVGGMDAATVWIKGTLQVVGDADNWVWVRTKNAVPIGKGNKVRISSSWVYGMVDVIAIAKDSQYIPEKEDVEKFPVMTALKVATAPVLDGKLDDACWRSSQITESFSRRDGNAQPSEKTMAMCLWNDDSLYIGMICHDKNAAQIVSRITKDDGAVFNDDSVEVFVDPDLDFRSFYHLACNVGGTKMDDIDYQDPCSWNGRWNAKANRFNDRWEIEIEIPFKTVTGVMPEVGAVWGFNLYRNLKLADEENAWSCPLGLPFLGTRFGRLHFGDNNAKPYVTPDPFSAKIYETTVSAKVCNLPQKQQFKLICTLIDSNGIISEQEKDLNDTESKTYNFSVKSRAAGWQILQFSLKEPGKVIYRTSVTDEILPQQAAAFGMVSKQHYYSSEKQAAFYVYINRPQQELAGLVLDTKLGNSKKTIAQRSMLVASSPVKLEFPLADAVPGDYHFSISLLDPHGKESARKDTDITILPLPLQSSVVQVDGRGVLSVNGKKRFPIAVIYGRPDQRNKQIGYDTALIGGEWVDIATEKKMEMEKARKILLSEMDRFHQMDIICMPMVCQYFRGREDFEALRTTVSGLKDHPALLGWYTADEPVSTGTLPGTLKKAMDVIHEIDPAHPVSVLDCQPYAFRLYADASDIFMSDPYPVPSYPLSLVAEWTDKSIAAMGDRGPVWMCMQTHGAPFVERGPTRQEFKNMNYQAIIHGAQGLAWWCYSASANGVKAGMIATDYQDEYDNIVKQIRALEPVLLDGCKGKLNVTKTQIHSLTKSHNGNVYILAANVSPEQVNAEFEAQGSSAEVMFEQRSVPIENGKFADKFAKYDVHVYRISQNN